MIQSRRAVAIRHVHFQDLGVFESVLIDAGFDLDVFDIGVSDTSAIDALEPDLLMVLGGPVGAYEHETYPFLVDHQAMLKTRMAADRPTFGICLGAQQMAAALGADVAPMGRKEIGFAPLELTAAGRESPLGRLDGAPVLHWHGDMFAIPPGAERLARTPLCENQAFSISPNIMGLQFHCEVDADKHIERWLVGHAVELSVSGVDIPSLREAAPVHGPAMREAARNMFADWLARLEFPAG